MGKWAWFAVLVGLVGLCASAAGQTVDRYADRPDPSDYFLPPVSRSDRSGSVDERPRRPAPRYDEYDDELPPPRQQVSGSRLRPIPPLPREDDYPPPLARPRRPALALDEEDYDPPPRRRASPTRHDDLDDELPPPRPRRVTPVAAERGYDDDLPSRRPRRVAPQEDWADDEPAPRRRPAAALAEPSSGIRRVSASELDEARTYGDEGRQQSVNIIDYLAGDGSGRRTRSGQPTGYGRDYDRHRTGIFGRKVSDGFDPLAPAGDGWFESDRSFGSFVSPVTNPFLFEDPRSLTEVRPIFIYQSVPGNTPLFNGGNLTYIGLQGRLAITERLSLVVHKFGGQGVNPSSDFNSNGDSFGFAEIWLGPKYTFLRDTEDGRIMAGGLQFQIPAGSGDVYQNTGSLSIVPYVSFAQNFLSTAYGSFNGLVGTGYAFSTNNQRSDYYYLSGHLDFDIGNAHRFYPLFELNWLYYTTNGTTTNFPFEGRDLINFGSPSQGSNLLTWAVGGRVRITRNTEFGGAFEGPLVGNRDLFRYRFTIDFIWRY